MGRSISVCRKTWSKRASSGSARREAPTRLPRGAGPIPTRSRRRRTACRRWGRDDRSPGARSRFLRGARRLTALAERLQAPVLLEIAARCKPAAILGDHPAFAGSYALTHPAFAGADILLYAGMTRSFEFEEQRGPFQPPAAQIVHLCSDPAQIGKLPRSTSRSPANAELGLRDLYAAIGPVTSTARPRTAPPHLPHTAARPMPGEPHCAPGTPRCRSIRACWSKRSTSCCRATALS